MSFPGLTGRVIGCSSWQMSEASHGARNMAYFLGVDTGGTYTDAVILDEAANSILGKAKALTSRHDLAVGIGQAVDAAHGGGGGDAVRDVALVSLSTTLATNALVEGQGARVALVFIGFERADLGRGGLTEALKGDPVVQLPGGHTHAGTEVVPLDLARWRLMVRALGDEVIGLCRRRAVCHAQPGA